MTVIVTDTGFRLDDWTAGYVTVGAANDTGALDVPSDADPDAIPICAGLRMIRVNFPSSVDGRGFTIARTLRLRGYAGRLRARGHIIADQYTMARRAGFDEVEIDEDLAARQPQDQWLVRASWRTHDYQNRLRGM